MFETAERIQKLMEKMASVKLSWGGLMCYRPSDEEHVEGLKLLQDYIKIYLKLWNMATEQHDEDPLKKEKDWVQKQEEWILAMSNDPKEQTCLICFELAF